MQRAIATLRDPERDARGIFVPLLGEAEATPPRQIVRYRIAPGDTEGSCIVPSGLPKVFRPIGREPMDLDIEAVLVPGLAIWSVQSASGFESLPDNVPDVFAIRIPLCRGLVSRTTMRQHETQTGNATILPAIDGVGNRFVPGARVLSCAVGVRDLIARYEALEGLDAPLLNLQPTVKLEGPRLQALVHTIRRIGGHIGTATEAMMSPLLVELLLNQILSAWPMDRVDGGNGSSRTVSLAIDYIEAHLAGPLTVGDVAASSGVCVRTLQSMFRARTGQTPLGYILQRRLERAHADLLANDGRLQVSQIAHRWGFLHMGEFARRYRLRYGCTPSQTGRSAG